MFLVHRAFFYTFHSRAMVLPALAFFYPSAAAPGYAGTRQDMHSEKITVESFFINPGIYVCQLEFAWMWEIWGWIKRNSCEPRRS